jgi:transposase
MLDVNAIVDADLKRLSPEAITALAQRMLGHIREQQQHLQQRDERIAHQAGEIAQQAGEIAQQASEIERKEVELRFKTVKLEKVNFELARLKAWKFGAKTEAMSAEQRRLFEETMAEDEASLQALLDQLQGKAPQDAPSDQRRRPRRHALPAHLRRVEHRHEPEDTTCPTPGCGRQMVRVGEDVSEKLDIVPAEFFVHRHVHGKWACKCCQVLVQEPVPAQIIDGGIAASGLVAHTLISRFVDHLPYYRQETINARSGVHTPRSTLAQQSGRAGAALEPLYDAHKRFVLGTGVLHADETPVAMLDPGAGKTKKAYVFTGSELAGQRAAVVMSLVQSAKLNGHDPHAYLRDVLERLPSHPASRIEDLLPHRWQQPS